MVGDELSHFKQAKTEVKTEVNSGQTTKSGGDFEDLENDVSPHKAFGFGSDDASYDAIIPILAQQPVI